MPHHSHSHDLPVETEGRLIRWAPYYDGLVNLLTLGQAKRLRRMTVELVPVKPGDRVLDVGCGTGAVTIPAKLQAGAGGLVAGIDPAPEMIATAQHKAQRQGLDIDFRVGVIESLPFPDESFDAVTSSLMVHHLPVDLRMRGLEEVYRVLKPGGCLLVADFRRPSQTLAGNIVSALTMHHGLEFGIEDLPPMLERCQFSQIQILQEGFLFIGFVRAVK